MAPTQSDAPRLLHVFPSFEAAGAQARTAALMNGFGPRFRHGLVALDGAWDAAQWVEPQVQWERLECPPTGGLLGQARALRRLLREQRPDLLLTYNWGSFDAVLAAHVGRRGAPAPAHVHHEDGFHAQEAAGQLARRVWARRLGLRRAFALAVPSRQLERLALDTWRLPRERVHWIPNGVDTERFAPQPEGLDRARLRAAEGVPEGALVVGAVGRLNPVKRFDRLIEACARLTPGERPVHLWIAGQGDQRAELEALAAQRQPPGGRVHFLGYRTDLAALYRALDVVAISSDSEQQPVSQLEAMASAVPVAATDVGDVAVTLPEEARGALVDPAGPDPAGALAAALHDLLADPARRAALGAAGRERVLMRYSRSAMLSAYGELYGAALDGRRS